MARDDVSAARPATRDWPRAVLFDLDGTLIDSAPDITAAVNELLSRDGRPSLTVAAVTSMIGDGVESGYLSRYLVDRGLSEQRVAIVFTALGQVAPGTFATSKMCLPSS